MKTYNNMTSSRHGADAEGSDLPTAEENEKVTAPQEGKGGACSEFISKRSRQLTNNWELLTDDEEEVQGEVLRETTVTLPQLPVEPPEQEAEGWIPVRSKRRALRGSQDPTSQCRDAGPRTYHGSHTLILSTCKPTTFTSATCSDTPPTEAWAPTLRLRQRDQDMPPTPAVDLQDDVPTPPKRAE